MTHRPIARIVLKNGFDRVDICGQRYGSNWTWTDPGLVDYVFFAHGSKRILSPNRLIHLHDVATRWWRIWSRPSRWQIDFRA